MKSPSERVLWILAGENLKKRLNVKGIQGSFFGQCSRLMANLRGDNCQTNRFAVGVTHEESTVDEIHVCFDAGNAKTECT